MKKKKILHVVEAFGGGIFTFLVDLVNSTSDEFDITIVYALRNETPEDFLKQFKGNVKFIKSKYLQRSVNLKNEFKAVKEIKEIIKNEQPDIIHLHSTKAGIIGRFATNDKNAKILYNPHGFSFLMKDISKLKKWLYWWIEKIMTIKGGYIIACSRGEYNEAVKLSKKSFCINNGINISKIELEIANIQERKVDINNLKICTVGRINYQKNPQLFNDIAQADQNKSFTWIGDGSLRNQLISSNILITGWKNREEVLKLLNDNDVFILPSLWEGLPIALLEAMYMKKVCIVSNVIGNKDVIKDNVNGFIAKTKEDYIKIINELNLEKIEQITNNARNDIKQNYSTQNMIKEYKKIYYEN